MKRVAIIGGGIAGLTAAYYLKKARAAGSDLEWTLFEKSDRFGGVIRTERRDDFVLEAGPDSFLTSKPEAAELCRDLGIGEQLIPSNDADRKTYILAKGRLVPIPPGVEFMIPTQIWPMVRTPLFSLGTKVRMGREIFSSARPVGRDLKKDGDEDESVASFVQRHFGPEMVERLAEPLLAGIYGGNTEQLSVKAVLPRLLEMERSHGSLVRAALQARRQRRTQAGPSQPALFTSLKSGMQQIIDTLVSALPATSLRVSQPDISLQRSADGGWKVASTSRGRAEEFDEVVLAVPAPAAAALLEPAQPKLASLLAGIPYTSSAAVILAYNSGSVPPGFGFLVPRGEGPKMLACTFVNRKFPHRAPAGTLLLRCFFSSSRLREIAEGYSDAALLDLAQRELRDIMGFTAQPRFTRVFRWNCALPQYGVGHLERVAEVEQQLEQLGGVRIAGNSLNGVGIPDCIRSARRAVQTVTSRMSELATVQS